MGKYVIKATPYYGMDNVLGCILKGNIGRRFKGVTYIDILTSDLIIAGADKKYFNLDYYSFVLGDEVDEIFG